jgi:hypothetical protein
MFSYNLPSIKLRIDKKTLLHFLIVLYCVSLIPMLIMGFYDWPSVDDFSMPLQPHQTFATTGSVLATIGSIFSKTVFIYNNWVGYFFSDFVTCLCPSVYGEKWYFITVFIILGMLTCGVIYFFDALFVKVFELDKDLTRAASILALLLITQSMENGSTRAEAFYWWSGAINYTFMFGLSLLWMGMVFRQAFDNDIHRVRFVLMCILGFLLGGSNYMTALVVAIFSSLGLIVLLMIRIGKFTFWGNEKRIKLLWLPFILNLLGIVVSAIAPGNKIRGTEIGRISPVKTIFRAYYSVFDVCMGSMMRWEVLMAFAVLAIIMWKLSSEIKRTLSHPFIFALFSLSIVAACIVPPIYAVGNIDAARLRATIWLQFIVVSVLTIFYCIAWIRQRVNAKKESSFSQVSSTFIVIAALVIIGGSALCIYVNPYYYSTTSALTDLVSGNAAAYKQENIVRLKILEDNSISEAVLTQHRYKPELVFQSDIYEDPSLWENTAVATYYNKEKVLIKK